MSDMFFKLGPDADSTITLYPEWDYENGLKKIEQKHRLQNADMYVYKTGEYEEINIKCKFFPLSDAAIVNSWWQSNAELVFYKREKDFYDWMFESSTDGWFSPHSADLTIDTTSKHLLIETNSDYGSIRIDISNSSFQGSEFYKIEANVKLDSQSSWSGYLFYSTAGVNSHSYNYSYYLLKAEPSGISSQYTKVIWDMRSLSEGGNNWIQSEIIGLRIYFSDQADPAVNKTDYVDYIDIGFRHSEVSSVMIRNTKKPFSKYQEPYADYMQGTIKLEGY